LRQLVQPSPLADGPYAGWLGLKLHDLESGAENGALNLCRGHMVHLDRELFEKPGADAVLTADFAAGKIALGVPWAEEFVLIEAEPDLSAEELVQRLALARREKPAIDGHREVGDREWRGHQFERLEKDRCFGFAVRMPDGMPVAGLLVVREVDAAAETVRGKHAMLFTRFARHVFAPGAAAARPRFVGELASGLRLEMLGVGHSPSTGRPWWRPDGSPRAEAPYHHLNAGSADPKEGALGRELAVEEWWGDVDFVTTAVRWKIEPSEGWGGHTGRDAAGRLMLESENRDGRSHRVRCVHGFFANLPGETVTIRREYAAGDHVERASWSADGTITQAEDSNGFFQLSPPVDASNGLVVTVENVPRDHDCRLILVVHDGRETRAGNRSGTGGNDGWTLRFREKDAKLADVAKVRLESRPFDQWIEFRTVSLLPGKMTEVEVVTSASSSSY
jgi:hypothetical protein